MLGRVMTRVCECVCEGSPGARDGRHDEFRGVELEGARVGGLQAQALGGCLLGG